MSTVEKLYALGSKGGLRIAGALSTSEWKSASEIAEDLSLHIATAVAHLSALASAGIAERRLRAGRRKAFEYRLVASNVKIEIDLAGCKPSSIINHPGALAGFLERLAGVLGADWEALVRLLNTNASQALKALNENEAIGERERDLLLTALVAGSVARLGRRATIGLMTSAGYDHEFSEKTVGGD
ncbi:MAG: hypothetical protein V1934_01390 [Methanobacteriota archaeon]